MTTYCAIYNQPLSTGFRAKLESVIGSTPEYLDLREIRQRSIGTALTRFRQVRADVMLLPIEDETSFAILPALKFIGGISGAKEIEIFYPDMRRQTLKKWSALGASVDLARTSLIAATAAARSFGDLQRLYNTRVCAHPLKPGRVLYLNANLWFGVKAGGSVGHIAGVANALVQMNQDLDMVTATENSLLDNRIRHIPLRAPSAFGLPLEFNHYLFNRQVVRTASEILDTGGYGFLYQRMSFGNYSGVILSRQYQLPLVLEYNGSEAWIAKHWGRPLKWHKLALLAEDVCLRHATVIVTVSDALKDELIARGVPEERIATYPNCIDESMFDPSRFDIEMRSTIRTRHGVKEDATVVSFLGTFGQWHGVDVLARAIRCLVDTHPEWLLQQKLHFMLIGDGLHMSKVKEILRGEKYSPFHTLTGLVPQKEAPGYLHASDLLVSPHVPNSDGSKFFGSPTKLFEYMAMGKPIIASDLDQIGIVLQNSLRAASITSDMAVPDRTELAVLCTPGSVESLVETLRAVGDAREWWPILGRNVRQEALKKYTWKKHVQHFLDALREVAADS